MRLRPFVLGLLLVTLATILVAAQSPTVVGMLTSPVIVRQGQTVDVDIVGNLGPSKLGAVTLSITYDGAIVDAVDCTANPDHVLDMGLCNAMTGNPYEVKFTGISAAGVTGSVRIGTITFFGTGDPTQSSKVDVFAEVWADVNGNPLPFDVTLEGPDVDGLIKVLSAPTPTPTMAPTQTPTPPPPPPTATPTWTPILTPTPTPYPSIDIVVISVSGEAYTMTLQFISDNIGGYKVVP